MAGEGDPMDSKTLSAVKGRGRTTPKTTSSRSGRLRIAAVVALVLLGFLLTDCFPGNSITSPDTAGNVGQYTSVALDSSGYPVVSYYDATNGDLKVLHCGDLFCQSGNSITSPDTGGEGGDDVGRYTSLALDSQGYPVVSYYDATNHDLNVLHCGNADCTSGNTFASPDTEDDVGEFTSLALDTSGNPVVSYYDATNGDLKVLHCGDLFCQSGNSITSPDIGGEGGDDVGRHTSLALDSQGYPVVSYYDATNGDLKVLHCYDATCSGQGNHVITSPDTGGEDGGGDVGQYTSLALDTSGNPVVSYKRLHEEAGSDLKVLHCGNADCTAGNSITSPDTGGDVGSYTSLALDGSGNPVVSYGDDGNGHLKVLHCGDGDCTAGNSIASPDTGGDVGQYTSLTLDGVFAIVSYFDFVDQDLKVLFCGNINCDAGPFQGNNITSPDTTGDVGQDTSLALDTGGRPVVSYRDATNQDLKVLHCGYANCAAGNNITSPDTAGDVGFYSSLALDAGGRPVVSYYDNTNGDLKVLHCGDAGCTTGNSITSPDTAGSVGYLTSLALDAGGNPVVSYYDVFNGDLKVLHCGNTGCTAGNSITSPDTADNVGQYTSLALDAGGNPVVSYVDVTNFDLKVLHCGNVNCTAGNSITSPDTEGDVGPFTSLALDAGGNPVVSYVDATNGDLKVLHCGDANCAAGTFSQLSAGGYHTCGLKTDGTLACWGDNSYEQATPPGSTFLQVSAGSLHTCGVKTDGTLACWGRNDAGQATPPGDTFTQVSAGNAHTCGVKTDGTLACWGDNTYGQATPPTPEPTPTPLPSPEPTPTPPAGTFSQVSAGGRHTCGVKTDGTLACWGNNDVGQATPPAGTFGQVSAGEDHTCGVKTDGTLACWGYNGHGEAMPPAGTFSQVSAGEYHTCGVKTDGTLACWGHNYYGQAGPPAGTFTQVSAGYYHTCGLKTDGTLACWGRNIEGQATPPNDDSITSPDTAGDVGECTSLALDPDGNPVVSYYDATNGDLKVLHCGDANCADDNSITSPDTGGDVGQYTSLALGAGGYPLISYYDATNGNLKVLRCDNANCAPPGIQTTAGLYNDPGFSGDGGPATNARLSHPHGTYKTVDGSQLISDTGNDAVRKIDGATGIITTIAGRGAGCTANQTPPYDGCKATEATLSGPKDVFDVPPGDTYIADTGNNRIRKINADGYITTVAGGGSGCDANHTAPYDGCLATQATLNSPSGVAVDEAGNIYIADTDNNRIRKVTAATGIIATIAGTSGTAGYSGDKGPAIDADAELNSPHDVYPWGSMYAGTVDLLIADTGNNVIRWIHGPSGIIDTFAGSGAAGFFGDGGTATLAKLHAPESVVFDASLTVYVADTQNDRIRRITEGDAIITTVAGGGGGCDANRTPPYDGCSATEAILDHPTGLGIGTLETCNEGDQTCRQIDPVTGLPIGGFTGTTGCTYGTVATIDLALVLLPLAFIFRRSRIGTRLWGARKVGRP